MTVPRPARGARPPGETWVWFASMGLAVGLIMVVGLLGLIVSEGVRVFWPKSVRRIELRAGSAAGLGGTNLVAGLVADIRVKRAAVDPDAARRPPDQVEWHLLVGNRDVYGVSFRYVNTADVAGVTFPPEAMVIERLEYGPAIGVPVALDPAPGPRIEASAPDFAAALRQAVTEAGQRRERIRDLERDDIGRINHALEKLRLAEKQAAGQTHRRAGIAARRAELEASYRTLAARAAALRAEQTQAVFIYRLFTGAERAIPVGQIVGYHHPNRMGAGEKLGFFLRALGRFLAEEPREANTEGGIFPALFGTFAMTLLMCVAVTPFGVLAAIYLREYARQGPFVRAVRISVNNLAGVPSIVFGVFGLGFFVYVLGGSVDRLLFSARLPTPTFGTGGILWAALTLALMTVPVVIVATEEALAAVPRGMREGSLALGASKWQTIARIVLPASAPGILTGVVLAMARGAGEVAPLMLVGVVKLAPSLPVDGVAPFVHLDRKFMHLGFHIYDLGFQSPDSDAARPMVFATTFFLILLVVVLNLGAIVVRERLRRKYRVGAF